MPVSYGSQIEEHHAVRQNAGMFDVSHMTVVDLRGTAARDFLRKVLANDVDKLKTMGKALYSALLNERGGVLDDLIVYRLPWGYRLVVNCATRDKDLQWLSAQGQGMDINITERPELSMIAVQGPKARELFAQSMDSEAGQSLASLGVFSGVELEGQYAQWLVARTGYTGEDGYEIILPAEQAPELWRKLMDLGARSCGLGARDTLRLEAGMNLYGHEMDETVSPLQANMAWTLAFTPERDFIGRAALEAEQRAGVSHKLVGLVMRSRGVLRQGYTVAVAGTERAGIVTSGSFSPTLGLSIALARVPVATGQQAEVLIRGKSMAVEVVDPAFVRHGKALIAV